MNAHSEIFDLISQEKYHEAWLESPALRMEFPSTPRYPVGSDPGSKYFKAFCQSRGTARAKAEVTKILAEYDARQQAAQSAQPTNTGATENEVQAMIDAGKFADAFAADPKIRAEFGTVGAFTAYWKAVWDGKVKHHTPRR